MQSAPAWVWEGRMQEQSSGQTCGGCMNIFYKKELIFIRWLMGNEPKQVRALEPQLDFHSDVCHPTHGNIRVFSSRALPMTFLMRLERITSHSRLYNYFQQVQDQQSSALLMLYGFKIQREEGCGSCEGGDRTLQYWQYLNYSLQNHIVDRGRRGIPFTVHEMWHVLQVALVAAGLLARVGLVWEVHPALLVVTPEGKLKADWSHMQLNNGHLRYYRALEEDGSGMWWFSPEEQWLLRERERNNRLNLEKCNVYKLGLLMLSVAALTAEPALSEKTWKTVTKYPQPLPHIISQCLSSDPRLRPSLKQLYDDCEDHFNSSYELLISEGRRDDLHELQRESVIRSELRGNSGFREVREGSKHSKTFAPIYESRVARGEVQYESYDHRLAALREYRRNLAVSRGS